MVARALRPCCLHQGDTCLSSQHGYHYTTDLSALSWDPAPVQQKVEELPAEMQAQAAAALAFLLESPSARKYQAFVR
eukprot:14309438-Alexandrium_andersonii.AAC.1